MAKRKPDNLGAIRIELQETERELAQSLALSYRLQALGPLLEVLQNPLKTAGVVTSVSCLIEFLSNQVGHPIETGVPCPSDWKDIKLGAQSVQEQRAADREAAKNRPPDAPPITPKTTSPLEALRDEGVANAIGTILGNLANPNMTFGLGGFQFRDVPDNNPFTWERVDPDDYAEAPGVVEAIGDIVDEFQEDNA
jgi:hypothetical protein